jgi:hypothetical protein
MNKHATVQFVPFENALQEMTIHNLVKQYEAFFPEWMIRLRIEHLGTPIEEGNLATNWTDYEKKNITIGVYSPFFSLSPGMQRYVFLHEILHAYHGFNKNIMRSALKDTMTPFVEEMIEIANEIVTEDVLHLLLRVAPEQVGDLNES